MAIMSKKMTVQVDLEKIKSEFGEKTWDVSLHVARVLKNYLKNGDKFTGKVVFTVNCRNGGIGNTEAFVQKKI